jgi:hypothetical protein
VLVRFKKWDQNPGVFASAKRNESGVLMESSDGEYIVNGKANTNTTPDPGNERSPSKHTRGIIPQKLVRLTTTIFETTAIVAFYK